MYIQSYGKLLAIGLLSALGTSPVFANLCDQPSPLHETLGEDYWDVEYAIVKANEVTDSNHSSHNAQAFKLLEQFDSYHYDSAVGKRHICKGAPDERRVVEFDSTLRVTANSNRAKRKNPDTVRLEYLEQADSKLEKISFDQNVIVDLPEVAKWQVGKDDSIKTSQVNRRRNDLGFSLLQQIDTELAQTEDGIQLTQTLYINGHRESWATWTLIK